MTAAHPTTRTAVDELLPEWDTRTVQLYMAGLLAYAKERGLEVSVPQQAAELILDAFNRLAATVTDPKCMDEWACMMPGDCSRAGHCLADDPKIESAAAPGADVAELMRVISSFVCSDSHAENLLRRCRDMLAKYAAVIAEHNKRCEAGCQKTKDSGREGCLLKYGCSSCPRQYVIEVK